MTLRPLRGWFGYFKHSKANVFGTVDAYVRGRLRSILRSRSDQPRRDHRYYDLPFASASNSKGAFGYPCAAIC